MALGSVLSQGRSDGESCLIGSIKTNIGHLESAAGVAGLIKAALILDRDTIPPNRNFETPNPAIPFEKLKIGIASQLQPLPHVGDAVPAVGVNSFGFGGTNAHVVLEAAPVQPRRELQRATCNRPFLLPISARDDVSLRDNVKAYRQSLAAVGDDLADFCYSAGARKEHHDLRLVAIGDDARQLQNRLSAWLREGESVEGIVAGRVEELRGSNVFVFTGQGSQWSGMGCQLVDRDPIVRRTLDEIDEQFSALSGWSLRREIARPRSQSTIDQTRVAQPAIFALQVALVRLWQSWGIAPEVVVGHSVGEIAAAWCAGIYSLRDAVRIAYHRSRLQDTTGGHGRMLAAGL